MGLFLISATKIIIEYWQNNIKSIAFNKSSLQYLELVLFEKLVHNGTCYKILYTFEQPGLT